MSQEVMHFDYLAISRGPLVYATDLIDGYKVEESLRMDAGPSDAWLETLTPENASPHPDTRCGPDILLRPRGRAPLTFQPYYRVGGRQDRAWRLTWMSLVDDTGDGTIP